MSELAAEVWVLKPVDCRPNGRFSNAIEGYLHVSLSSGEYDAREVVLRSQEWASSVLFDYLPQHFVDFRSE
jgi:hypothetical protein